MYVQLCCSYDFEHLVEGDTADLSLWMAAHMMINFMTSYSTLQLISTDMHIIMGNFKTKVLIISWKSGLVNFLLYS